MPYSLIFIVNFGLFVPLVVRQDSKHIELPEILTRIAGNKRLQDKINPLLSPSHRHDFKTIRQNALRQQRRQ